MDSGPPRAQLARLPPSRNGTSASRRAAAAFLSVASISRESLLAGHRSMATRRGVPGMREPMPSSSDGRPAEPDECRIRIAAAGDIHCGREGDLERWSAAFARSTGRVDVVLLAGDLTTHGEPEQAAIARPGRPRRWTCPC